MRHWPSLGSVPDSGLQRFVHHDIAEGQGE